MIPSTVHMCVSFHIYKFKAVQHNIIYGAKTPGKRSDRKLNKNNIDCVLTKSDRGREL